MSGTTGWTRRLGIDQRTLNQEIGLCVRSWATLHEDLANLFRWVIGGEFSVAFAMWHSLKSDLAQRELLLAAVKASRAYRTHMAEISNLPEPFPQVAVYDEIIFAVNEITALSHKRNDAAHSPIVFPISLGKQEEHEAEISDYTRNPRAKKLKNFELFQYFRWINARTRQMQIYVSALSRCLYAGAPLPNRPRQPPLSQFPTRKRSRNQNRRKRPPSPPRP